VKKSFIPGAAPPPAAPEASVESPPSCRSAPRLVQQRQWPLGTEQGYKVAMAHAGPLHLAAPGEPRRISFAAAMFDMSRGRQALLSVAQPVICVLLALGHFPDLRTCLIGTVAAVSGELMVFSLNDVMDHRADAQSLAVGKGPFHHGFDIDFAFEKHPIARGHVPHAVGVAWVAFLAAVFSVSAWALSPWCIVFFAAAVVLEVVYCLLRTVSCVKTVVSGVMVGVGSMAGWVAVAPLEWRAVWPFLFLAFWETCGRNMANDLGDVEFDRQVGIATVAVRFGAVAAGRLIFAGAAATVALAVTLPMPAAGRLLAAAAGVWAMLIPGWRLVRRRAEPAAAAAYFNHACLYPVLVLGALLVSWLVRWMT